MNRSTIVAHVGDSQEIPDCSSHCPHCRNGPLTGSTPIGVGCAATDAEPEAGTVGICGFCGHLTVYEVLRGRRFVRSAGELDLAPIRRDSPDAWRLMTELSNQFRRNYEAGKHPQPPEGQ